MSYRQQYYQIPKTPLGESFRELVNNDDLIHDRRCILANLKNVAHQWFHGLNILKFNAVDPNGRVRYIDEMCSRPWGMKGPDRMWCEGFAIPLIPRERHIHVAVELCIAGGNGQLWSTKPTAGLRYKSAADGSWSNIRWFGTKKALWLQMHQDAMFRKIDNLVEWTAVMEPGMSVEDPERYNHGFRIEGSGSPQLRLEEIIGDASGRVNGADIKYSGLMLGLHAPGCITNLGELKSLAGDRILTMDTELLAVNQRLTPPNRIDFTKLQLVMANGFAKSSRPEISAQMASLGIASLCSRCVARYGLPGDPKRANFLSATLDDPENPWLPGKTADETYLWVVDYIYNMLGACQSEQLSQPIAEAIGEPLLEVMAQAVSREPTAERSALIFNLRKSNAPTTE